MSKIKELKSNPEHILNIVNVLELFSPDAKSKYTDMLLRLMKGTPNIKQHTKEITSYFLEEYPFIPKEKLEEFSDIQLMLIYKFVDGFFNSDDLKNFRKFCEYNERNLVTQTDLTTYKSFQDMLSQLSIAEMRADTKGMENEIIKVYEDDEWLLLRPLTYLASKKYGSNTKWCTTSEGNSEYFIKYSSRGVLIYCVNKKSGYKVASFYSLDKNDPEFSFWNQKDSRIDSLDSELTDELRKVIQGVCKDPKAKTNRFLLSDDQRTKEDKLLGNNIYKTMESLSEPVREEERPLNRRNRIGAAIRRENEIMEEETVSESPMDIMESIQEEEVDSTLDSIIDRMRLISGDAPRSGGYVDNNN